MKKIVKAIAVVLIFITVFSLVGCNKNIKDNGNSSRLESAHTDTDGAATKTVREQK